MTGGFHLEGNLQAGLRGLDMHVKRGIVAAANYTAPLAQQYMRSQATWTDRSGAARNGLKAQVVTGGDKVAIVLYHSVPYGIWLEVRWGGKYAIIEPTMAATMPLFLEAIKRIVFDE